MEADVTEDCANADSVPGDYSATANELLNLVSISLLPQQNNSMDQPLEAAMFKEHIQNCEADLKKAVILLEKQSDSFCLNKKLAINIILLCGEHSINELWTSPLTVACAEELLKLVLDRCKSPSVIDLLKCYNIDHIFTELRPKLLKSTWKNNPAAVVSFIWILSQIKCPDLGDVLNSVLPTCLLLIDDHVYSNKIKGLQCLEHIANNVSRAELNQYGRGSVMYSAVEHMIYFREPEIIPPLAACLTALLTKTERGSVTDSLAWSHLDDVLNIWLPSMEMEQNILLREAYIESLSDLLQAVGLASVRWSKKLLNIISEYSEQDHTRDKALQNLLTFMKTTWPRLAFNFQSIVIILMKVVIKITKVNSEDASKHTLKLIRQCFKLLETVCNEQYELFVKEIKDCSDMREYFLLLSNH